MSVLCDYCKQPAELVTGRTIYPHRPDLANKPFYQCAPCKAYVGCHPGTVLPLGRLADSDLRNAKSNAHKAFDSLWLGKVMTRTQAYGWLAKTLELPPEQAHIGMFDIETCRKTVQAVIQFYRSRNS